MLIVKALYNLNFDLKLTMFLEDEYLVSLWMVETYFIPYYVVLFLNIFGQTILFFVAIYIMIHINNFKNKFIILSKKEENITTQSYQIQSLHKMRILIVL